MKTTTILLVIILITNLYPQGGWIEQSSGVTVQLTSVSCLGIYDINAWICGYSGTVLRTTNRGVNWLNVSGNGIPATVSLTNIIGFDANTALTTGNISSNTYVYRTTNGGSNWVQVFFQAGGFINAIGLISNNHFFMEGNPVGGRWSLWKSTNLGANWDSTGLYLPQAGNETGWNNAMFCYYGDKIWIGTNNTGLYYSSNRGSNWVIQPTFPEINSFALYFKQMSLDGYLGGATMLFTSNGGLNWSPKSAPGTGNFGGITGHSYFGDHTYYVRSDNKIYYNSNGGNFTIDYTAPTGNYRHVSGSLVYGPFWAIRDNGGITFHDYFGGINRIGSEIPGEFSLHQNYPNPFNPATKIKFDVASVSRFRGNDNIVLKIFDIMGREIAVLINEQLQPGTYEVEWDGSNYTSGVYFINMRTDAFYEPTGSKNRGSASLSTGYSETKKMVLIK